RKCMRSAGGLSRTESRDPRWNPALDRRSGSRDGSSEQIGARGGVETGSARGDQSRWIIGARELRHVAHRRRSLACSLLLPFFLTGIAAHPPPPSVARLAWRRLHTLSVVGEHDDNEDDDRHCYEEIPRCMNVGKSEDPRRDEQKKSRHHFNRTVDLEGNPF